MFEIIAFVAGGILTNYVTQRNISRSFKGLGNGRWRKTMLEALKDFAADWGSYLANIHRHR